MKREFVTKLKAAGIIFLLCLISVNANAAQLTFPVEPLYLDKVAYPNVMMVIDNSGSMKAGYMPDGICSGGSYDAIVFPTNDSGSSWYSSSKSCIGSRFYLTFDGSNLAEKRLRSAAYNLVYYDPYTTYKPWKQAVGAYANAPTNAAPSDPNNWAGNGINFTVQQQATNGGSNQGSPFWASVYYNYTGPVDVYGTPTAAGLGVSGNYARVEITNTGTYTGGPDRSDCVNAPTCTSAEELQNFANWYTFYRTRRQLSKGGASHAFYNQSKKLRVGYATLTSIDQGVRRFDDLGTVSTNFRSNWYSLLLNETGSSSTPLRSALDRIGQYYENNTTDDGPWGADPGTSNTDPHPTCRQSYTFLMTDGYYGGSTPSSVSGSNVDGTDCAGCGNGYTAQAPYSDGNSETLADVAMHYYYRDLQTGMLNNVPTSAGSDSYSADYSLWTSPDDADWQHMSTFTVGLGVVGTLDPYTDWVDIYTGATAWPDPTSNGTKIDDLWHAAVNGHGKYFSAKNPTEFGSALSAMLREVVGRISTASSVSLSSTSVSTGASVFQAQFNTDDWSGNLFSMPISTGGGASGCNALPIGTVCENYKAWNAATVLTDKINSDVTYYDTRKIATYKPSSQDGIRFRWPVNSASPGTTELDSSQVTALNTDPVTSSADTLGEARLNYVRGKDASGFRTRLNYLGDIVHAAPAYLGPPNSNYPDYWGSGAPETSYTVFKNNNSSRAARVYAAANDGMLHAFDASTGSGKGSEVFAYVPAGSFANLNHLSSTEYTHKYFVDGTPIIRDAFFAPKGAGTADWHSALVGGLRSGGQGVYALDVTSATVADEYAAADKVLWEFTGADDPDLGYVFGEPSIVRMYNGRWAAIVGNGYNNSEADGSASTTGHATLFILFLDADVSDGWDLNTDYIKLDTVAGSAATPNGLASPAVVDVNGDLIADYIYAGDLLGNMWKFNVTDTYASNWATAFGTAGTPTPLFSAVNVDGYAEPITTRPQIGNHNTQANSYMVYFGTGKYLEPDDNLTTGKNTQTFYGVWDKNGTANGVTGSSYSTFDRRALLKQAITYEITDNYSDYRITTSNSVDWYTDPGTPAGGTLAAGSSNGHLGWFMDLVNTQGGNTDNYGEVQVSNALLRNDKIIFTTLLPSTDPCEFGGSGWLMELNASDGARLTYPAFDVNGDGVIDDNDLIQVPYDVNGDGVIDSNDKVPPSGRKSKVGIVGSPAVASSGQGDGLEYKMVAGSTGDIESITESEGPPGDGRQSWQQLQ